MPDIDVSTSGIPKLLQTWMCTRHRALTNWRFAVLNSHFWCWDSYFLKEAIFFCIVGLPLFGKEGSGTPVFKILVRALKAAGPDSLWPIVLKELGQIIAPVISIIFQISFDLGTIPSDWKKAQVCPLFKKVDETDPAWHVYYVKQWNTYLHPNDANKFNRNNTFYDSPWAWLPWKKIIHFENQLKSA